MTSNGESMCTQKWVGITRNQYEKAKAYVKTEVKGQRFELRKGVRQGDPLSLNLFNYVPEEIF